MNGSPDLLLLIALPLVGAGVVAAIGKAPARTVKLTALGFSLVELVIAAAVWIAYRRSEYPVNTYPITPGIQGLTTQSPSASPVRQRFSGGWIPTFGNH